MRTGRIVSISIGLVALMVAALTYPTAVSAQSVPAEGEWLVFEDPNWNVTHLAQHSNGTFYGITQDESHLYQILEWEGESWKPVGGTFESGFPQFEPVEDGRLLVVANASLTEWTGSELRPLADTFGLTSEGAHAVGPGGEIYRAALVGVWTSSIRVLRGGEWVEIAQVPFIVEDLAFDKEGDLVMVASRDDQDQSVVWQWNGPNQVEIGDFTLGYAKVVVEAGGSLVIGRGVFSDSPEQEPLRWDGQAWSPVLDEPVPWTLGGSTGCGGELLFIQGEDQVLQLLLDGETNLIPRRPNGFSYTTGSRVFHQSPNGDESAVWIGANHSASDSLDLEDLLTSCDYDSAVQGDVLRLYKAFFNRNPDISGAKYWLSVNDEGHPLDQIAEQFALSTEFNNTYEGSSNEEFLTAVYTNVLGRDFDQVGFDYWLGLLNDGQLTRGGVVRWVAANAEFRLKYPFSLD